MMWLVKGMLKWAVLAILWLASAFVANAVQRSAGPTKAKSTESRLDALMAIRMWKLGSTFLLAQKRRGKLCLRVYGCLTNGQMTQKLFRTDLNFSPGIILPSVSFWPFFASRISFLERPLSIFLI